MNQPYARVNKPYATLTLASALREMFGVQSGSAIHRRNWTYWPNIGPMFGHEQAARFGHRLMLLRLAHYKRDFKWANISDRFDWPTTSATSTGPI